MERIKAVFNWSCGKDSAHALLRAMQSGKYEIVALLTTVNRDTHRSTMHGIPTALLQAQADSIGIPLHIVDLTPKGNMEDYGAATLRPNTLRSYEQFIRCYIKPYLGDKIVSRVTRMDIQKLYRKLKHEGRVREHPEYGHELSDTMVLRIHAMLHRCLKDAEAAHVIARNPTDGAVVPKANHRPKQILTKEQMDIFLAAVDRSEIWRDFFYTELTTGLRRGEICGLMWQDFDEAHGTLAVRRTIHAERGGRLTAGETKTGAGKRIITLPPSTAQLLSERRKRSYTEWIFPDPLRPERPTRPNAAYVRMKELLKKAGLPSIRFHDLRHTFATHALASGVDAKTLSGILGHTQASFTLDTYTHVTGDMQKRASEIVDGFMENIMVR